MTEIKVFPIGKIENENDETKIFLEIILPNWIQGIGKIKRYALAV